MSNAEWSTPQEFFDRLNHEFRFNLDPCATDKNAKCTHYFTKADNGLTQPWDGIVFVNPPYGHTIIQWTAKAQREAQRGATVVMLLPARTDTRWWHDHIIPSANEIRFIRGRLYFTDQAGNTGRSPFPSVVVVFHARSPLPRLTSMNARRKR